MTSAAAARWLAGPTSSELGELAVEGIALDRLRIEGGAVPFGQLGMALVSWIDDGLEELGIAPGSADVFGRAAALGLDQAGIGETRCWIADALDLERMFPAIAEGDRGADRTPRFPGRREQDKPLDLPMANKPCTG